MRKRTHFTRHRQAVCTVCTMPLVWSTERGQLWCSVYGSHAEPPAKGRWVTIGSGPIGEVIRLDIERERRTA